MEADWVIDIQEQCEKADVAFFFKQWGGKKKKQLEVLVRDFETIAES